MCLKYCLQILEHNWFQLIVIDCLWSCAKVSYRSAKYFQQSSAAARSLTEQMLNFCKIPSHESLTEDTSSSFKSFKLHIFYFCSITILEITKQKQPFKKRRRKRWKINILRRKAIYIRDYTFKKRKECKKKYGKWIFLRQLSWVVCLRG